MTVTEGSVSERPPAEVVEPALIALAGAGDEIAFTKLYDTYYDRVYRYIYYRVGRVEDAEDLTQKVFLEAWRAIGRFRVTNSPFVAWLITIAHNVTMSHFRSLKAADQLLYDVADQNGGGRPEHVVEGHHEQERLRHIIRRLKADYQQVITMRFLEDFEYDEIASALGKSEGNVRVIQHRALQQLRDLLKKEEYDGAI